MRAGRGPVAAPRDGATVVSAVRRAVEASPGHRRGTIQAAPGEDPQIIQSSPGVEIPQMEGCASWKTGKKDCAGVPNQHKGWQEGSESQKSRKKGDAEMMFTVFGHPQPQGSVRAFTPKGWKRPILTSDNAKLKSWRQEVAASAMEAARVNSFGIIERPAGVIMVLDFYFAKPKSTPKKITENTKRPDVDKLTRATFDSLRGILYEDDSQVVSAAIGKHYGQPERTEIIIEAKESE
jgi:Holliday junction resolvase RusA-like endonuclease